MASKAEAWREDGGPGYDRPEIRAGSIRARVVMLGKSRVLACGLLTTDAASAKGYQLARLTPAEALTIARWILDTFEDQP